MKRKQKIIIGTGLVLVLLIVIFIGNTKLSSKITCELKGGRWSYFPGYSNKICNLPTSDAGKVCLSDDECEGDCIGDQSTMHKDPTQKGLLSFESYGTGKCSDFKKTSGCHLYNIGKGKFTNLCAN